MFKFMYNWWNTSLQHTTLVSILLSSNMIDVNVIDKSQYMFCVVLSFLSFLWGRGGGGWSGGQQDFLYLTATGTEHSDHGLRPLVYLLWQTDYCLEFVWNSCLVTFRVIKTKPILTGIYTVHLIKKPPKFPGRDHIHNDHFECMLTISNWSAKFQFYVQYVYIQTKCTRFYVPFDMLFFDITKITILIISNHLLINCKI